MGKKDINKNFRVDDEEEAWIGRLMQDLDCSLTDLVRTSLFLASGQLRDNPALLRLVTLDQLKSQQNLRNGKNGSS